MKGYWTTVICELFDEWGISASKEQTEGVVDGVVGSHENYSTYVGHDIQRMPSKQDEVKKLKEELEKEKSKVVCPVCKGNASVYQQGPYHSAFIRCYKCNGTGRI